MLSQHEKVLKHIKQEVIWLLESNKKTITDITSFSVIQKSNDIFCLYVWWTGKVEKGVKTKIEVELDTTSVVAKIAIDAMMELKAESKNVSLLSRIDEREKQEKNTEKYW